MERTVLFSKDGSLPVGWVAATALLLFFLVGHESGTNAQSHSHDPGEGLGEFLHEMKGTFSSRLVTREPTAAQAGVTPTNVRMAFRVLFMILSFFLF